MIKQISNYGHGLLVMVWCDIYYQNDNTTLNVSYLCYFIELS